MVRLQLVSVQLLYEENRHHLPVSLCDYKWLHGASFTLKHPIIILVVIIIAAVQERWVRHIRYAWLKLLPDSDGWSVVFWWWSRSNKVCRGCSWRSADLRWGHTAEDGECFEAGCQRLQMTCRRVGGVPTEGKTRWRKKMTKRKNKENV